MKTNTIILTIIGSVLLLMLIAYIIYQFYYYGDNSIYILKHLPGYLYTKILYSGKIFFYLLLIPLTVYILYLIRNILFFITKASYSNNKSYSDI